MAEKELVAFLDNETVTKEKRDVSKGKNLSCHLSWLYRDTELAAH